MANIPSKQLHRSGTLEDLQANLSNREIGFCTTDRLAYYKLNGILFPMGSGIIPDPTENALFMAYDDPEHPGEYIYGWKQFTEVSAPYDERIKLWSRIAGMGLYAEVAFKDSKGRKIADTLDKKTDATDMTPGTYTKVSVNEQGAVTNGGGLEASDLPTHEHSAEDITSGTLDPDRIGEGSVPIEKLEIHKRLYVDGTTISATETADSVVIHVGSVVIPLDLNASSAENEYTRAVELCDAGVVPIVRYMVTNGVAYARLSSRGSWGLRFTNCNEFTVTQITIAPSSGNYAISVDSRIIPV